MRQVHGKIIRIFLIIALMMNGEIALMSQDSLLNVITSTEDDSLKIELMIDLADQYSRSDQNDMADRYYREAIALAIADDMQNLRATALDKLGTHLRRIGLFDQSLEYHLQALEISSDLGEKHLLASIYNHIGVVYRRKSEDNLALKNHLMALRTAEEIRDKRNISYACNSIGIIYTYQKNFDEALDYFNRALKLAGDNNNMTGVAINLNSVAWVYELQEQYDSAIVYYERSLEVNRKAGNQRGMAICNNDLGKLYHTIGAYNRSLDYYGRAREIYEKSDDLMHIAINRINLGQVYTDMQEFDRALRELNSGLELAGKLNSKRLLMDGYEQLANTYERTGNLDDALYYLRLYANYRDSIYNEESARQIAEFKTLFDTEQKEKENILLTSEKQALDAQVKRQRLTVMTVSSVLLLLAGLTIYLVVIRRKLLLYQKQVSRQNEQLRRNEKKLSEMIATKDKFFKIIAHDLRNHFNVLMGFSELLSQTHREIDVDERDDMISNVTEISKETFSLLENLLVWARSQTENLPFAPKEQKLFTLVDATLDALHSMAKSKNITITSNVDHELDVYADMDMLKTILRNLVMNAVKFSHEGGEITVNAESGPDFLTISVSDQGVGMSSEKLKVLFDISHKTTSMGTGNEQGTGLGLMLCKEFAERHGGKIRVESEEGKGSVFHIMLPHGP